MKHILPLLITIYKKGKYVMLFKCIHSNGKKQTRPRKLTLVKAGEEELNFSTTREGKNSHVRLD